MIVNYDRDVDGASVVCVLSQSTNLQPMYIVVFMQLLWNKYSKILLNYELAVFLILESRKTLYSHNV